MESSPSAIAAFLDKLGWHEDYGDRVPGVRELCQAPGSFDRCRAAHPHDGLAPDEAIAALGYRRQEVFRREPIVWLDVIEAADGTTTRL